MIGARIGMYCVTRLLGRGGMGAVYEALHEAIGQRAAVKVMSRGDGEGRYTKRFFEEARLISAVRHPGIVQIYDFNRLPDGTLYILMELLEGETLAARCQRLAAQGGLRLGESLRITRQLAATVAAVHERGVLHRDIKPENVMLVADADAPGGERVKLLDFGIARPTDPDVDRVRTTGGMALGTPTYMSPEQCGGGVIDGKADVYALGVMLYELVAGRLPFQSESGAVLMRMHLFTEPQALRETAPHCPRPLADLVTAMLAKLPEQRPAMAEVAARLGQIQEGPLAPSRGRSRLAVASVAMALVAVAAMALWQLHRRSARPAPAPVVRAVGPTPAGPPAPAAVPAPPAPAPLPTLRVALPVAMPAHPVKDHRRHHATGRRGDTSSATPSASPNHPDELDDAHVPILQGP